MYRQDQPEGSVCVSSVMDQEHLSLSSRHLEHLKEMMRTENPLGDTSARGIHLDIQPIGTDRSVSRNNPAGDPYAQRTQLPQELSMWRIFPAGSPESQPPMLLNRLELLR